MTLEALLRRDPSDEERREVDALAARIRAESTALEETLRQRNVAIDGAVLTRARIESSGTLGSRRTEPGALAVARAGFLRANARVMTALEQDEQPTLDALCELNALVRGLEPASARSSWREGPSYIDLEPCPAPESIAGWMAPMFAEVARRSERDGILWGAGLLYQWCISVHPFDDANGRTARLVTDWVLGRAGMLPVSFARSYDSFVALHPNAPEPPPPPGRAALVIARGVLHTLAIVAA